MAKNYLGGFVSRISTRLPNIGTTGSGLIVGIIPELARYGILTIQQSNGGNQGISYFESQFSFIFKVDDKADNSVNHANTYYANPGNWTFYYTANGSNVKATYIDIQAVRNEQLTVIANMKYTLTGNNWHGGSVIAEFYR